MRRVLTVGVTYTGDAIEGVEIENLGLCRPGVDRTRAAYPLYEYDTIIINPESYSHFLFGTAGERLYFRSRALPVDPDAKSGWL